MGKLTNLLIAASFAATVAPFSGPVAASEADGNAKVRFNGAISETVGRRLSVKDIESAGVTELVAYNPYDLTTDQYTGIWLQDLVKSFGNGKVSAINATAIDQYVVTFEKSEWEDYRIMLVTKVNGEYIGFDAKGPVRVIYPDYDAQDRAFLDTRAKWIWMIKKIEFVE